jgi:signal transduction histidine kinase
MRRMLSNISHDLRTPLTVISGYVEMLLHRTDIAPEERAALLGKVSAKVQEVTGMINTFFDLAKLESGDRELPLSRVYLNEVCRRNILSFYDVLTDNGFEVQIDIPDEPIHVYANEEALDRILNNLISNAIRYGGEGRMLGLSVRADGEAVLIEVTDRGKGIQEHHQDHIFERLYTLEDSRNRKYQGSGLGLTITKRLVELMHGSISVTSKPYEKTTFTVWLKRMTFGSDQT